ncbi:MAG: Asp23/Gls24 family envelope stress response protein [Oscillibacter sp.]|nr:Asp23/Gls24 family envelope stress response protein [Oscillibacter sp.]
MLNYQSEHGEVSVSSAVFSNMTGAAATNCFGVKGMAFRSITDGLVHLLRPEAMSKGVNIIYHEDDSISIELHIIVENGVNIPAVCRSIMNEVRYVVHKNTGVTVRAVDVYVDSMIL